VTVIEREPGAVDWGGLNEDLHAND
jgi:hypothetical protein